MASPKRRVDLKYPHFERKYCSKKRQSSTNQLHIDGHQVFYTICTRAIKPR